MEPRSHIGSFRMSRSGELVAADASAARIVGYASPAALLAAPLAIPLDEARARARTSGEDPGPTSFEATWVAPTGEQRRARVLLVPSRAAGSAVGHFEGVLEELEPAPAHGPASSPGFVEDLLDGLPNPVFVKDEQHRWVLLNSSYCRLMGTIAGSCSGAPTSTSSPRRRPASSGRRTTPSSRAAA